MSMKGSPIGWWKEKRHRSYSGISAGSGALPTRPATALAVPKTRAAQEKEDHERNFQKLIEDAVLAAFNSDAFKEAVASQLDPAAARQQEKLNQLKTNSLNLESTLQTRMDEFPAFLKPIEDHLTSLDIPDYRKEMDDLATGQEKILNGIPDYRKEVKDLAAGQEKILSSIPNYRKDMEDLAAGQEKILSSIPDYRKELEDLAARQENILNDIPDYRKEMEDLAAGQDKILKSLGSMDDRIKSLEETIETLDGSVVNSDLRSAIRFGEISNELQDQNTILSDRIWELERTLGKRVDAQQRRVVGACEELGRAIRTTQDRITSFEEANTSGLEKVILETAKVSSLVESTQKQISKDETSRSKSLKALESDTTSVKEGIKGVRKQLDSLDTTPLKSHTLSLESLASNLSRLEGHVNLLDTTPLVSHTRSLESLASNLSRLEENVNLLDTTPLVSHSEKLSSITSMLTKVDTHLSTLDTTPLTSHTEQLGSLATNLTRVEKQLGVLDTTPLDSHTTKLEDLKASILKVESSINEQLLTQGDSLQHIQREISLPQDTSKLEEILVKIQDTGRTSTDEMHSISTTLESILNTTTSTRSDLNLQSESINTTHVSLQEFRSESVASLTDIANCVNSGNETFKSRVDHLISSVDIQVASLAGLKGAELMSALQDSQELNLKNSTALDALKQNSVNTQHAMEELHKDTISQIEHNAATISSGFENAAAKESSRETEVSNLQIKLQAITETLERHGVTLQAISTFKPIVELSQKVFESYDILIENKAALSQNANIYTDILSKSIALESSTEKIADLVSTLDGKVKDNFGSLLTVAEENKSSIEENISKALSTTSTKVFAASESIDSVLVKLVGDLDSLNEKISTGLKSIAAQSEGHKSAIEEVRCLVDDPKSIADILQEVRSSRTILEKTASGSEVLEGLASVKTDMKTALDTTAKEISNTKDLLHDIRHNQRGDNILKAINEISEKQFSQGSTVLQSLQSIQDNTVLSELLGGLESVKLLLEDVRASCEGAILPGIELVQKTAADTTKSIENIMHDSQQFEEICSKILNDVGSVKQVALKNECSSATISERTVELDTKIKMGQDALQSAIQEIQTAINRDILDTTRSITNSVNDVAAGLEINIKDVDSRIATSTKVLRAEIKAIDLSPFDALRTDIDYISKMASETTKQISATTEEILVTKSHIISENAKSTETLSEVLRSHVTSATGKATTELLATVGSLEALFKEHDKKIQDNLKCINMDVSTTTNDMKVVLDDRLPKIAIGLSKLDPTLTRAMESIESINNAIQRLEQTTKASEMVLSGIDGKVSTSAEVQNSITAITDLGSTVDKSYLQTLQAIQANDAVLSSIQEISQKISSSVTTLVVEVPSIREAITKAEISNKTTLETIKSRVEVVHTSTKTLDSKIEEIHVPSLLRTIQETQVAVEANGEVLTGLATSSSVKSISAAICRVDKTVLETGAQVKGIIYEGNKKVIKEIDSVLSQLDESINQNEIRIQGISEFEIPRLEWQLARNYDALHIIGARVIGTSKRFEEAIRDHSGGHQGKGNNHLLVGRLRSESNARSNASSGKDSGGTRS